MNDTKEAVIAAYLAGKKYTEIAEQLGIGVGKVAGIIRRSSGGCTRGGNEFIDMTGQRFGYLLVERMIRRTKEDNRDARCILTCDCGKVVTRFANTLRAGRATNCGCITPRGKPLIDMTGQRFGRLVVTQMIKPPIPGVATRCVATCDCGKVTKPYAVSLRQGLTRSCGCLHSERMRQMNRERRQADALSR